MDEIKFNVRIKFASLIIGVLMTFITIIIYIISNDVSALLTLNDKINTIIQIFGIGIALTTLIYVAINQNILLKSRQEESIYRIKRSTSELISIWSTKEMFSYASIARKVWYNKGNKSDEEFVTEINNNESIYIAVITILNFLEQVSQLIDEKIVDERMLKNFYLNIVKTYKDRFYPLIESRRKEEKTNLLWCDFEKLAIKWDNESIK